MTPYVRWLLNLVSISVTGFVVVVFLVGDWSSVYGNDVWMKALWVGLLFSTQTFLGATWKPSGRVGLGIGLTKWALVWLAGLFFLVTGLMAFLLLVMFPVLFIASWTWPIEMLVGFIFVAQGGHMLLWATIHRGPVKD